jgi:hypothetical protein
LAFLLAGFVFFTQYAHPVIRPEADKPDGAVDIGIVSILLQTALFMGGVLFAVRHWRLPLGTFTILYVVNGTLAITQGNLSLLPAVVVASLLTGILLDLLYAVLKPTVERREMLYLFAFLAPVVVQTVYFLMLLVTSGIAWTVHLWMGSIFLSGTIGLLLSALVVPVGVVRE